MLVSEDVITYLMAESEEQRTLKETLLSSKSEPRTVCSFPIKSLNIARTLLRSLIIV